MKLTFEDKSYIEITKSNTPNKVFLTVAAKSVDNSRSLIVNTVEISEEELIGLIKSAAK